MPAESPGDAKRAELVLLSSLHRVSVNERPMVERFSRGLGEKQPDPMAWWTTAEAAAAHEEWIREQFSADEAKRATPLDRMHLMVDWIVYAMFVGLLFCLALAGWNAWLPGGGK